MKRLLIALPVFLLPFQDLAKAQSMVSPVVAKQRMSVYKIYPDGSRILMREEFGNFYRSSLGASTNIVGLEATFVDAERNAYEISHRAQRAQFVQRNPPFNPTWYEGKPHEIVNGYDCAVNASPTVVNGTLVKGKALSATYWHVPTGLLIKLEATHENTLTVRELYDIEFVEPDQSLVRIPDGYLVNDEPEQ